MNTSPIPSPNRLFALLLLLLLGSGLTADLHAQSLLNVDFGVGSQSKKTGFAATGQGTNDFWNLYRHYDPRYTPGMALISDGQLGNLKLSDGSESKVAIAVKNAPGVWGNATGDSMYDGYVFAMNGSNITVRITGLDPGRYHFYLYGHADPDVTGEQNSRFTLQSGTNRLGPLTTLASAGWKASVPWQEDRQHVVFRDVEVRAQEPVLIEVAPGPNGVAVLNGLQILSRGTQPPRLAVSTAPTSSDSHTNLFLREVRYTGKLRDSEARFQVRLKVESLTTNRLQALLFKGDVAVLPSALPEGVRLVNESDRIDLQVSRPGEYDLQFEVLSRITSEAPWNRVSFTGPPAAIAFLNAEVDLQGAELQLLSGTPVATETPAKRGRIDAFLGPDHAVNLRWQGQRAEVARRSMVSVDTTSTIKITPTVIQYTTRLRYEILQAPVSQLQVELPEKQTLTKVEGQHIRDWKVVVENEHPVLRVELLRPVDQSYELVLNTEQTPDPTSPQTAFSLPRPLQVNREAGSITLTPVEMTVAVQESAGLRQVNASGDVSAAYRFFTRPFQLSARLSPIEPAITTHDVLIARLDETRFVVTHLLNLKVERAGIYGLDLPVPAGFTVAEVSGKGVEEWTAPDGKLRIQFNARLLGDRRLQIQLERALKDLPPKLTVSPIRVAGAARETAEIGAASAPGLRIKTDSVNGLREIPAASLGARQPESGTVPGLNEEVLAYVAEQPDWELNLAAEKLAPRIIADVFNLVTVGNGVVGGSATIRYGILNQGVQEFQVKLPAHWRNIEFTGPHIRRKDQAGDVWTITLQDKAWGAYTLLVTYDHAFDLNGTNTPSASGKQTVLDLSGAHVLNVERETGSVAITTAASLKLEPQALKEPLRTIDPTELSDSDRSLINRPVLLAYRYSGNAFALPVNVTRHELATILEAVADRTQLTSVLTTDGQMLTQASFMVKNNEKQFQRFRLPQGATLWACYVNGEPVKAEKDGEWTLVSLPQSENRDQAFAADVVYAQHVGALGGWFPKDLALVAPQTDLPSNYAEWQIYTPPAQRLGSFGGTMIVARGTTYDLSDAWDEFFNLYLRIWKGAGMVLLVAGLIGTLLIALVKSAVRHGTKGMIQVLAVFAIFAILAGMLLPSLAKAKGKAQRIKATSNLKQIALAARMYAGDNKDKFPATFEQMMPELGSDRILIDPASGQRFVYVGEGKDPSSPNAVLAYSPEIEGGRAVAFADGSVRMMNSDEFVATVARDSGVYSFAAAAKPAATPMQEPVPLAQSVGAPARAAAEKGIGDGMIHDMTMSGLSAAGVTVNGVSSVDLPALATASGIRSIRIDIPRTGRAFNFTKVLNNRQEPLSVKMSVMQSSVFSAFRTLLQLAAFLGGLFLLWREWHRPTPGSFRLAIAVLLTLTAVTHLLLVYRILHWALIVGAPLVWLVAMGWLVRRFWKLQAPAPDSASGPGNGPEIPASPALPIILLLIGLTFATTAMPAMAAPGNTVPQVTILSAEYTGIIREQSAQFDVQMRISSAGTNQMITLFSGNTALQEFVVKKGEARLLRNEQSVAVVLANPGETILAMKLTTPVTGDVTGRKLSLTIPPTLSSRMEATLNDSQAEVEFPSAVSFNTAVENGQTRITGVVGASGKIDLAWTPKVQRTADAATAFCDSTSRVTLGGGVQNVRSTLNYHVTQGELRQLNVRLPRGHRLLRVEGAAIRTWELVAEAPGDSVHVELLKPVASSYALTIETEMLIESLPRTVYVGLPRAQGVVRESGVVAVKAGDEASLDVVKSAGLQRIDNTEFNKAAASGDGNWLSAWRYLKPDFDLQVQMSALKPQIEVVVQNRVTLDQEQARLIADLKYTIKRAGIFQLRLQIPPAYRVDEVTSQKNRMDWSLNLETRTLEIRFKERLIGDFPLRVALTQTYMNLPATLAVGGVHPLDTDKVTGTLSVSSDAGVSVKTQQFTGLTEIPVTSLAGSEERRGGLAFKYQSAAPASASASWSLSVSTEPVEPWLKAEVVNIITVTETLLTGRSVVRYDIDNAPVRDFKVRLPAAWKNVELVGQDIRRRDQDGNDWRVELQNRVKGSYLLTVTWEMPRPAGSNLLALAGVEVLNVERETGSFTLLAKAPLQLVEKSLSGDLTRIDARELPAWSKVTRGGRGEVPVLSYRYLRPGAMVNVAMQRFTDAAVLQALVEQVRLSTVVADDGQMMTELSLSIRNNGRQHLEVELPAGATLWAAFVGGEPVRPGLRGNKLMLPLEHSGAESEPVSVELTYVGAGTFPKNRGRMELVSPKLDLPLKNARWDLYLPPDYDYDPAGGTMIRDLTSTPVLQSYSIFEYGAREQQVKRELSRETRKLIQQAEGDLKEGNLQKLGEVFSRAKQNRGAVSVEEVRDLSDLEAKLKKTQASNYIQAQNAYADNYFNGGQSAANGPVRSEGVVKLYEMEVAEKQVSKVQQAQELTLAKAQPLRVNLPTRGLVQSFTQVMQTEGDKPMTIGLEVNNTRDVGWMKLLVRWTAAFIILWILCAITLRKRTQLQEA